MRVVVTMQFWTAISPLELIPREEDVFAVTVATMKRKKSFGVDNIPEEFVQAGGETIIDVLTRSRERGNDLPHRLSR